MSASVIVKLLVDFCMTVLLFFSMAYQWTGNFPHEVLGMVLLVLFVLHHLLNLRWYKALRKGTYSAGRIVQTVMNFLLLILMLLMMATGILMSRDLFPFFPIQDTFFLRQLHMFAAHWGFLLMALHLGWYWQRVMGAFRKMRHGVRLHKPVVWGQRALVVLLSLWGIRSMLALSMHLKLIMRYTFGYWDFERNTPGFFLAYFSILTLFAAIGHYGSLLLRKGEKRHKRTTQTEKEANP